MNHLNHSSPRRLHAVAMLISAAAVVLRLTLPGVTVSPDGVLYLRLAENLGRHFCLSESDPLTAECAPSWGGQPPGYPLFIASIGRLFGYAPTTIIAAQSLAFGIALCYLLISAGRLKVSRTLLFVSVAVVAFSPAVAGVSRWILTETVAASAVLWVLAECYRSIGAGRVSVPRVSLAVVAAAMMRWDMIFVAVLPIGVAATLHPPRIAFGKIVRICGAAVAPYAVLVLRAGLIGLPLLPPSVRATPQEVPPGVLHFWETAAITERATATFLWGVWTRDYRAIRRHEDWNSFLPLRTPAEFDGLFESLAALEDGQSVPAVEGQEFEAEARRLAVDGGWSYRVRVLLARAYQLWNGRESIFGWFFTNRTPYVRVLRRVADAERSLFLVLLLIGLWCARSTLARNVLAGILAVVCLRTAFLAGVTALEIRYLIPTLPLVQFGAVAGWAFRTSKPGAELAAAGTASSGRLQTLEDQSPDAPPDR